MCLARKNRKAPHCGLNREELSKFIRWEGTLGVQRDRQGDGRRCWESRGLGREMEGRWEGMLEVQRDRQGDERRCWKSRGIGGEMEGLWGEGGP